jgi:hypothetical protein
MYKSGVGNLTDNQNDKRYLLRDANVYELLWVQDGKRVTTSATPTYEESLYFESTRAIEDENWYLGVFEEEQIRYPIVYSYYRDHHITLCSDRIDH